MFLIKGIKERIVATYAVPGKCVICEHEGTTRLRITQRYVHLFWVPVFPLAMSCGTRCEECTVEVPKKQLAPELKVLFHDLRRELRTPQWMWSGSAVLAVLVTLLTLDIRQDNAQENAQLMAPLVGDVYTIKLGHKHYTLERVVRVNGDTAFVLGTHRSVEGGVMKLVRFQSDTSVHFDGDLKAYTQEQRLELGRSGTIRQVWRAGR